MKQCTKCHEFKELIDFYNDIGQTCGLRPDCKNCCKKRRKKQYDKFKIESPELYKTKTRESHLQQEYGINSVDYNILFTNQLGRCRICNVHQDELKKPLFVDHCHTTNKIRGLLCDPCNRGLGCFKDTIELFLNAIKYLRSEISS